MMQMKMMISKKPELIIFDMDGLMFDTGRLTYRAYLKAAQYFDFSMKPEVYYYFTGRTDSEIRLCMRELYGEHLPIDQWRDYVILVRKGILQKEQRVYKKKGLMDLLMYLKDQSYQIALASSSSKETIAHYFKMEDMPNVFDTIISGDQVHHSKPNPEIFLKACQQAQILPENALVLEDSMVGIQAAVAGNMQAIWIPDNITDLPSYDGKYPMLVEPKLDFSKPENVMKLNDLDEVRERL